MSEVNEYGRDEITSSAFHLGTLCWLSSEVFSKYLIITFFPIINERIFFMEKNVKMIQHELKWITALTKKPD